MTLLQLRMFLAVADRGGFTLAAEQLGVTQPAVSRAIAALERELGVKLLVRHRDGVTLTEAGNTALSRASEIMRQLDQLRMEAASTAGKVTGTVRIASLRSVTGTLMAAQLRTFGDSYPLVRLRLFEGADQEVVDWLRKGAADIGVVTLPCPNLHTELLGGDELVAVLPSGHELARKEAVGFPSLSGEPFILATGGCGPLILDAARAAGARLDVAYEASELMAILEMVSAGLGVSVVPTLGLPRKVDSVAFRRFEPPIPRTLAVALSPRATDSPAARAFMEQVAAAHSGSSGRTSRTTS
ncbi:LysR family transcriptional regulator [Pseudonocardia acaciae]|uniref:LysR family transcriptional regulator n=1 Tax=Pseudonocardia acaciae TaxID=551276 RepID=UPI000684B08F|nr:LysR family transcriptional regulator [Pseudonocardia acaciae]